jgi:hypothetical protein
MVGSGAGFHRLGAGFGGRVVSFGVGSYAGVGLG